MKRQPKNNDAASPKEPAASYLLNLNRRSRLFSACPPFSGPGIPSPASRCIPFTEYLYLYPYPKVCVARDWRLEATAAECHRGKYPEGIQRPSSHSFSFF